MLSPVTTTFIERLRSNDQAAWFELWQTFGPVVRAQLLKWGKGRVGPETVQDLTQDTLTALSESIDRYDPKRGARFSTWLLAIAKHVLGDELDRRHAQKRGGGQEALSIDESWMAPSGTEGADEQYEAAVFRAKVEAALRRVEADSDFLDFQVFSLRVLEAKPGKEVAEQLGMSEPTVSRRAGRVRSALRIALVDVMAVYSFTEDEQLEAQRHGLAAGKTVGLDSGSGREYTAAEDAAFDDALSNVFWHGREPGREPDGGR